jgi:hypothetical protein
MTHNEMPKDTVEEQADKLATSITNLAFEKGARLRNQDYLNVKKEIQKALTTAYNKGVEVGRVEERERIAEFKPRTIECKSGCGCLYEGHGHDGGCVWQPKEYYEASEIEPLLKALTPLPDDKL